MQFVNVWNSYCSGRQQEAASPTSAFMVALKQFPLTVPNDRVLTLTDQSFLSDPPLPLPLPAGDSKGIEDMDMNTVRLCFQCELEWDDGRKDNLSPVVSNPIYDKSETSPRALSGIPQPPRRYRHRLLK